MKADGGCTCKQVYQRKNNRIYQIMHRQNYVITCDLRKFRDYTIATGIFVSGQGHQVMNMSDREQIIKNPKPGAHTVQFFFM